MEGLATGSSSGIRGWVVVVDRGFSRRGVASAVPSPVLAVGIHGATGRMGTRLIQLIQADPGLRLAAAIDRADHPQLSIDAGVLAGTGPLGVPLSGTLDR